MLEGSDAARYSAENHLFVATSNKGKLNEFRRAANEYGIFVEPLPNLEAIKPPVETAPTFEENARCKAEFYSRHLPGQLVFADDSGLEVSGLSGAPGVLSARYAASAKDPQPSDSTNNYKLLYELSRATGADRSARFVCVIAIAKNAEVLASFTGTVEGEILIAPLGHGGFGYDPLFYVPPLNRTLAELEPEAKIAISHRGKAFAAMLRWVRTRER